MSRVEESSSRGRQPERSGSYDVLRVKSPNGRTTDIPLDGNGHIKRGEASRFIVSEKNTRDAQGNPRPASEQLTYEQLTSYMSPRDTYKTRTRWESRKVNTQDSALLSQRYDPIRNDVRR
jgi:hypothetical protein